MEIVSKHNIQIMSGSHNQQLAKEVAEYLGTSLTDPGLENFANGEVKCHLDRTVRGRDVFIFQSHSDNVSEAILEQAIIIDAAKRASARHITAVCPYFGYSRQDRKSQKREPITAKLVVDILSVAGAQRITSADLHAGQIQGFFDGPFDHMIALPAMAKHLKKKYAKEVEAGDLVIVSPDAGRVKLAERYASRLNADIAIVHKRRTRKNEAEAIDIIGDVENKQCIIIDDMIDTAGTICSAAELLKKKGAASIDAIATHGLFSDPAAERLMAAPINTITVSNTLDQSKNMKKIPKLEIVSLVELIGNTIKAIFEHKSVSQIFDGMNQS